MRKRLPKFTGEDQERLFWATHDSTAYLDWKKAKRVALPNLKPSPLKGILAERIDRELRPTCAR
jgi:hypothetical protein